MFILQKLVPVDSAAALTADVGAFGQSALDPSNGDVYVKLSTGWTKVADSAGNAEPIGGNGPITLKNSSGTITRNLTSVSGVATLADTDTIVASADTIAVKNNPGNVTQNGAAVVTAGALTGVTLAATVALVANGASIQVQNSANADGHAATVAVAIGVVTAAKFAATVAMVDNGDSIVLQNSSGTVSSGNAGLNSPAAAVVSAGVISAVKAAA